MTVSWLESFYIAMSAIPQRLFNWSRRRGFAIIRHLVRPSSPT